MFMATFEMQIGINLWFIGVVDLQAGTLIIGFYAKYPKIMEEIFHRIGYVLLIIDSSTAFILTMIRFKTIELAFLE